MNSLKYLMVVIIPKSSGLFPAEPRMMCRARLPAEASAQAGSAWWL